MKDTLSIIQERKRNFQEDVRETPLLSNEDIQNRMDPKIVEAISGIASVMKERGTEGYVVGGFVRDIIAGKPYNDIDLAVLDHPVELCHDIDAWNKSEKKGNKIQHYDVKKKWARLYFNGVQFDINPLSDAPQKMNCRLLSDEFKNDRLFAKVGDFDYTINTMVLKFGMNDEGMLAFNLIDKFGGQKDLNDKKLKLTRPGTKLFDRNPVAVMRGLRFVEKYGLTPDKNTQTEMDNYLNFKHKRMDRLNFLRLIDQLHAYYKENGINAASNKKLLEKRIYRLL